MSKGLEALEKIRNWKCFIDFEIDTNGDKEFGEELAIIKKELKALEIIIKHFEIEVYHSRHRETGYEMNIVDSDGNDMFTMITQEEYDLLKEIL